MPRRVRGDIMAAFSIFEGVGAMPKELNISIKRIYEPASDGDGCRILVDRLWPRGVSKERAHLDEWMKDVAPSNALREWFHHEDAHFAAFSERYEAELSNDEEKRADVAKIIERSRKTHVTLLYGAKDPAENQAAVLLKHIAHVAGSGSGAHE